MILVDGGYLSWTYGVKAEGRAEWRLARHEYGRMNKSVILFDHHFSFRAELDKSYKARRRQKRAEDEHRAAQYKIVQNFIAEVILEDETIHCLYQPGLEADDLIAAAVGSRRFKTPIRIVGVDKDLLQLPQGSCHIRRINGAGVDLVNYARRLPSTLGQHIRRGRDVLLSLVMMGDRSDSIERILPPRKLHILIRLLKEPSPFRQAYEWYGNDVLTNLYLAVLPGPWCFNPIPTPEEVMYLVDEGSWWSSEELYTHLYPDMNLLLETLETI